MNLKRAITGPLLSFVFLTLSVYAIFCVQGVLQGFPQNTDRSVFLSSLSDSASASADLEQAALTPGLDMQAQSAISVLTNLNGQDEIVFRKNEQRKLSIASISKLMTALVVLENYDLSRQIVISDKATNQTIEPEPLKSGETYYVKDLLYAMLIGSDNAAGYAFSELIGPDNFISLMNNKAQEIGLYDTSFGNPTGLGLYNFSTTSDLVKLAKYLLMNNKSILGITTMTEFDLYTAEGKILHKIKNTNELLGDSSSLAKRIIGGKTGETRSAGECLLLVVKSSDDKGYLINAILNSDNRSVEMKKMIDWADASKR